MRITVPSVFLATLLLPAGGSVSGAAAQERDEAVLTGMVRDSASGAPVGYALVIVVGKDLQVFAGESGRFTLTGLGRGEITLRVQQIGYRPVRITVPSARDRATALIIHLARQPVVLPEVVVHGN